MKDSPDDGYRMVTTSLHSGGELPFVPEEKELDQLIAGRRSKRMAAFLQALKETFADPGELLRLRWIDISDTIVTINYPVKRHSPRQLKVSSRECNILLSGG